MLKNHIWYSILQLHKSVKNTCAWLANLRLVSFLKQLIFYRSTSDSKTNFTGPTKPAGFN